MEHAAAERKNSRSRAGRGAERAENRRNVISNSLKYRLMQQTGHWADYSVTAEAVRLNGIIQRKPFKEEVIKEVLEEEGLPALPELVDALGGMFNRLLGDEETEEKQTIGFINYAYGYIITNIKSEYQSTVVLGKETFLRQTARMAEAVGTDEAAKAMFGQKTLNLDTMEKRSPQGRPMPDQGRLKSYWYVMKQLDDEQWNRVCERLKLLTEYCNQPGIDSIIEGALKNVKQKKDILEYGGPGAAAFMRRFDQMTQYVIDTGNQKDKDQKTIKDTYFIESTGSDPHSGGEHALFLINRESGKKSVYKRHSLKYEEEITGSKGFIKDLAEKFGPDYTLPTMEIDSESHTEEYVERVGGSTEQPITKGKQDTKAGKILGGVLALAAGGVAGAISSRHLGLWGLLIGLPAAAFGWYAGTEILKQEGMYEQQMYKLGMLQAVAAAIGLTDLHGENIVFSPDGPIAIDGECGVNFADTEIENSTGPGRIEEQGEFRNISALYSRKGQIINCGREPQYLLGKQRMEAQLSENKEWVKSKYREHMEKVDTVRVVPLNTSIYADALSRYLTKPDDLGDIKEEMRAQTMEKLKSSTYAFNKGVQAEQVEINEDQFDEEYETSLINGTIPSFEICLMEGDGRPSGTLLLDHKPIGSVVVDNADTLLNRLTEALKFE